MEHLEKRKGQREECFMAVNIAYDDKAHTDFIRNISRSGMFIDSNKAIPAGRALLLTYDLPGQGPTKCIGQVVWMNSEGMGVRLPEGGEF